MPTPFHFDPEQHVLHDEDGVLALSKPPGLPSTGRNLEDDDCVQWHVLRWAGTMVWAVHQLDADTSGVLLFTRERSHVAALKAAMAHDDARKEYVAFVRGRPHWNELSCFGPIGPTEDEGTLGVTPAGRSARSTFRVLSRGQDCARIDGRLFTGRTHQLRIHLSHLGHPLLGEEWYAPAPCKRHQRQALHAARLRLGPPYSRTFTSPLPADLLELGRRTGLVECPHPRATDD